MYTKTTREKNEEFGNGSRFGVVCTGIVLVLYILYSFDNERTTVLFFAFSCVACWRLLIVPFSTSLVDIKELKGRLSCMQT